MAFASYDDLQATIARYLKRTNLTDSIQDFIALAESRLNRSLRVRQMRATYTVVPAQNLVSLPSDYQEAIRLAYGSNRLTFVSERAASDSMQNCATNLYTIAGENFWLLTNVDGKTKLEVAYYQQIPALSDNNSSNWLLEDAPDIYLYASLLEAEPFLKNDSRIPVWRDALTAAINDLQINDESGQYSGASLAVRAA